MDVCGNPTLKILRGNPTPCWVWDVCFGCGTHFVRQVGIEPTTNSFRDCRSAIELLAQNSAPIARDGGKLIILWHCKPLLVVIAFFGFVGLQGSFRGIAGV